MVLWKYLYTSIQFFQICFIPILLNSSVFLLKAQLPLSGFLHVILSVLNTEGKYNTALS